MPRRTAATKSRRQKLSSPAALPKQTAAQIARESTTTIGDPLPGERTASPIAVALLLAASGCCALVFQVVWMRELRLIFGATTASSAAVLAIFMGGLGLGSAVLGRRFDRTARPLWCYGWLEAAIALTAAVSPLLIDLVEMLYISTGGQAALGFWGATFARLLAAAVVLVIPTFLMGGTLPAAARAVAVDNDPQRRGIALVYGLNTLGAVFGAGVANFWLLEQLGARSSLWLACLFNFLLAAAALAMARRLHSKSITVAKTSVPATEHRTGHAPLVYTAAAIVGFAFFLMEIVWYRMLGTLLGGTTYTFGLILCIALLGIGCGGALYHVAARWLKPNWAWFALSCALEALCIALPFWWGDGIALWVLEQQRDVVVTFNAQIWNWAQVGAPVILPAALVAGFQFPLLIAIAGSGSRDVGRQVGWTCAANTLGAMIGSIAGGFFLLPLLTATGAWQFVVGLLALLALVAGVVGLREKKFVLGLAILAAIVACFAVAQTGPTAVWRHSGIGAGRAEAPSGGRNALQDFLHRRRRQCIWEAEGIESSIAITATDGLSFIVNGKADGNAFSDAGTQVGLGLVGPLLHRAPRSGLVIGLGTGESAGWLAAVESIETVDVVELEPAVVEMARRCVSMNCDALANPKLKLHYNDAREHLLSTAARYDLIVSEPSNPYRAGIASLYTREFYQAAHARLAERGLFLQWLQGYEVDDHTVRVVLHTLRGVFPVVEVWRTKARDMLIVCGQSPDALDYDAEQLTARIQQPMVRDGLLRAWRVDDVPGVLAHYVCGSRTLDEWIAEVPETWNTDDCNVLEYAFAKTVGRTTRFSTHELQARAMRAGDDSPLAAGDVDVNRIRQRRIAMVHWLGSELPDDQVPPAALASAEALAHYRDYRFDAAVAAWQKVDVAHMCRIEQSAYAHALAECGAPVTAEMIKRVSEISPAEGEVLRALGRFHAQDAEQTAAHLLQAMRKLKSDPWASVPTIDALVRLASMQPDSDQANIARLFRELQAPWAAHRMDDARLMLRYVLAEKLGDEEVIAALEPLEPHVPWKGWFLENRARVYQQHAHPRAAIADRDAAQFERWHAAGE